MTATIVARQDDAGTPAGDLALQARVALLNRIEAYIREQGSAATYTDVAQNFRLKARTVREYMAEMRRAGRIRHAARDPMSRHSGRSARWEIGAEQAPAEDDGAIRRIVQSWPPHHFRDGLVFALFGPARVAA